MSYAKPRRANAMLKDGSLAVLAVALATLVLPAQSSAQVIQVGLRDHNAVETTPANPPQNSNGGGFQGRMGGGSNADQQVQRSASRGDWQGQQAGNGGDWRGRRSGGGENSGGQGGGWRSRGASNGNGGGWQGGQSNESPQPSQTWRERAPRQDSGTWQSQNGGGWRSRNQNAGQAQTDGGWRSRNNNGTWQQRDEGSAQTRPDNGWRSRNDGQAWRDANRRNSWRDRSQSDTGGWRSRDSNRNWRDANRWRGNDSNNWRDGGNRWSGNNRYARSERHWNRHWRDNNRYDWHRYRERNRNHYRIGRYHAPYDSYSYRRLGIGYSLSSLFYSSRYWIEDPWAYRLPEVYGPYRWVRYYDDVLLVDIYTGEVVDVIHDFFW